MNARKYCGVDSKGKPVKKRKEVTPPSVHGGFRSGKRKTKLEREMEDRVDQQNAFITFLNKKKEEPVEE